MESLREAIQRVTSLGAILEYKKVRYCTLEQAPQDSSQYDTARTQLKNDAIIADITYVEEGEIDILPGTQAVVRSVQPIPVPVTAVHLPNTVTFLDPSLFSYYRIKKCTLPDSLPYLGRNMFQNCEELEHYW